MKRSEIVNKLVETIGSHDSWKKQCEYMLQICEDEGMRPPYDASQDDEVDTFEWEPE